MAINETEKNGGRVLGRSSNRGGRNARRDRLVSIEEDHRRIDQSETFSRPTMGAIPSHQYPVGLPSMGYPPLGAGMPPYSRIPAEFNDPGISERPLSPSHHLPHVPSRYHPGSMVFQPRSMADRYIDRPYFSRPPSDLPAMYWTSPSRHGPIPPGDGSRNGRDRFNSETSEGGVFEGRDPRKTPEAADRDVLPRRSENPNIPRVDMRVIDDRLLYPAEDRPMRIPDSDEKLLRTPERIPIPGSEVSRTPDKRLVYSSEKSPRGAEDAMVHYNDDRNRTPEDHVRAVAEDRIRAMNELGPGVFLLPEEPRRFEEQQPRLSPQKLTGSDVDDRLPTQAELYPETNTVLARANEEMDPVKSEKPEDARPRSRLADNWSRYDRNNLDSSPLRVSPSHADEASAIKGRRDITASPEEDSHPFRTQHEEMRIIPS